MNHRMLFFLSVIVTAVGIIGIIWQEKPQIPVTQPSAVVNEDRYIITAQAAKHLYAHHLINKDDYTLKTIKTDDKSDPRDLSSLNKGDLHGYLIKREIQKGDFILPASVESPESPGFFTHALKRNEAPYTYQVKAGEEYLFSALSVGDAVSIFIRLIEVDRKSTTALVQEGDSRSTSQQALKNYIIQKLMGPVNVIKINKDSGVKRNFSGRDPTGEIVLKVTGKQLAELKAVEKTGEILLFPFNDEGGVEQIRMDEVLPQFGSTDSEDSGAWKPIKQLRGKH